MRCLDFATNLVEKLGYFLTPEMTGCNRQSFAASIGIDGGQRVTDAWQEDLEAILPDLPYVGITPTMPMEFRTLLLENRQILHGIPAMGAEAVQQWEWARYGLRLIVIVVQRTFGGFLNFVPHLHVMVSAGGLRESSSPDAELSLRF